MIIRTACSCVHRTVAPCPSESRGLATLADVDVASKLAPLHVLPATRGSRKADAVHPCGPNTRKATETDVTLVGLLNTDRLRPVACFHIDGLGVACARGRNGAGSGDPHGFNMHVKSRRGRAHGANHASLRSSPLPSLASGLAATLSSVLIMLRMRPRHALCRPAGAGRPARMPEHNLRRMPLQHRRRLPPDMWSATGAAMHMEGLG